MVQNIPQLVKMTKEKKKKKSKAEFIPYQKCPKCNAQGTVSVPEYLSGDVHHFTSCTMSYTCDVCDGYKIIPMYHNVQVD